MVNLWSTTEHALGYLARADTIPHRTEGEAVLLDFIPKTARRILDLGTGDGRLLALLKIDRPQASAIAVDFSPIMLEKARSRFQDDPLVEVIHHNLDDKLPDWGKFDAIVSSFAIHHVSHDRKRSLYQEIFDLLEPGGVLANLEHVASPTQNLHIQFLSKIGYTLEEEDPSNQLLDVESQLQFLREIGFGDVDCYWKWLELGLMIGVKNNEGRRHTPPNPLRGEKAEGRRPLSRSRVHQLATESYSKGDYTGWFEALYAESQGNFDNIPWADRGVNLWLSDWMKKSEFSWQNRPVLVVGCGLGDDAEYMAGLGAKVTAFDLSPTAIDWCYQRFPKSQVNYQVVDLFAAPSDWLLSFDLVIEIYTIQALPANIRPIAIDCIGNFVAPKGKLLVVCRGRNPEDPCDNLPFPLTQDELNRFTTTGLTQTSLEDFIDRSESSIKRRFRIVYERH